MGKKKAEQSKTRAKINVDNPQRIGAKLRAIRRHLHYSQTEILKLVTPHTDPNLRATISQWETGTKYPTLTAVLKYARLAAVSCELLLDDYLDLPDHFHTLDTASAKRRTRQQGIANETAGGQTNNSSSVVETQILDSK